jgi:hypothetical protein
VSSFDNEPQGNLPLVMPPQTPNKRAAGWQTTAAALGAIAIVILFLWGINNQRDETSGQPTAATQTTPALPAGEQHSGAQQAGPEQQESGNAATTTGQGGHDEGEAGQKANSGQTPKQQPTNSGQNNPSSENKGQ